MTTLGVPRLNEMTVVVTGAASGIGRALALGFAGDGARVVACDLNEDGLAAVGERGAITVAADVTNPSAVDALVGLAVDRTGRLDVLINNAGLGFRVEIVDHSADQFERLIRVNLFGPYHGMRAAIPVMRSRGFGRIINLLSRGAEAGRTGMGAYGASKAGLFALTRTAARETAGTGILVNGLIPGMTRTAMNPLGTQQPEAVYPTARMLATLQSGGPSGRVFWNEKEYFLFDPANGTFRR